MSIWVAGICICFIEKWKNSSARLRTKTSSPHHHLFFVVFFGSPSICAFPRKDSRGLVWDQSGWNASLGRWLDSLLPSHGGCFWSVYMTLPGLLRLPWQNTTTCVASTTETSFLTVLNIRSPRSRSGRLKFWWELSFWFADRCLFAVVLHGGERKHCYLSFL